MIVYGVYFGPKVPVWEVPGPQAYDAYPHGT